MKKTKYFLTAIITLGLIYAAQANAATFTVTNTNESGAGSLRAAITQANANGQADTINFDPAVFNSARTITLTSGDLQILRDGGNPVTINGPGANLLMISGGNVWRIFTLQPDSNAAVSGMTLRDGNGNSTDTFYNGYGGAINANSATLTVSNVTFRNNSAIFGGGLYSAATQLSMSDALFTENTGGGNPGASGYAGFYAAGSNTGTPMTIRNTVVSNNISSRTVGGAGILNANVSISNLQITGNRAETSGDTIGGLRLGGVTGTATDVTISNNVSVGSWGGMYSQGSEVIFRRLTVTNNTARGDGAGIGSTNAGGFTSVILDSLIANNSTPVNVNGGSTVGGGMHISGGGTHYIINTTIANNLAGAGGGIFDASNAPNAVRIINSTITRNTANATGSASSCPSNINGSGGGGGVKTLTSATARTLFQNTIVAGNTAAQPACGNDVYSIITSNGYNLIGDTTASTGFGATGDKLNVNPQLGDLQNNGGATLTIAPQSGSPAINAGSNALAVDQNGSPLLYDQRGACFARIVGATVDIGAVEFGATGTCTSNGKTVGVFRPTNGITYLRNSNTGGFADVSMIYGVNGDTSIAGDWNGDRVDSLGIYRNGVFYLRNANTTGPADIVFAFGSPGDQPVAGDWNGDGIDTIGVYRQSTGVFLLRNSNTAGAPDLVFVLGNPGDVAIAGDWNGDGITTTGVFRPTNGIVYLKNTNVSGNADIGLVYGNAGDKPVAGDWDKDGIDSIGIYRNGVFYLRNSNTQGVADIVFAFGNPGDEPIAGDWDGAP